MSKSFLNINLFLICLEGNVTPNMAVLVKNLASPWEYVSPGTKLLSKRSKYEHFEDRDTDRARVSDDTCPSSFGVSESCQSGRLTGMATVHGLSLWPIMQQRCGD